MGKIIQPLPGRDYSRLENGALVVARCCPDIRWPYDPSEPIPDYLGEVDHSLKLSDKKAKKLIAKAERDFNQMVRGPMKEKKKSLIIVLQGRDGAGKTGARKQIDMALDSDSRLFLAVSIGAPTEEERAHPYLWRFTKFDRMPEFGQVRVFDRSWAERLLVEPVMKYTSPELVQKSYAEIRAWEWLFEQQGAILVKVWMDITKDEQARRFEDRAEEKPWKISESDTIARENWDLYTPYANEMFHRTGTEFAPWHIVSSQDKLYSRVAILQIVNQVLKSACS